MNAHQPSITDIVGLCVFIATMLFSAEVAEVVGPYLVIITASAIGASFSLKRREKSTRTSAILFFVRVCGLAALLTVGVSAMVAGYHPSLSERVLLAPVAFIVGLVGDDWPAIAWWAIGKVSAFVDVLIKLKGGGQ